jgi:hypothetical protein
VVVAHVVSQVLRHVLLIVVRLFRSVWVCVSLVVSVVSVVWVMVSQVVSETVFVSVCV